MTKAELRAMIDEFRRRCSEFDPDIQDLDGLIKDTGGAGLCDCISAAMVAFLRSKGVSAKTEWIQVSTHPAYPGADCLKTKTGMALDDHAVVKLRTVRIDLSARQFGDHFPYPHVWSQR